MREYERRQFEQAEGWRKKAALVPYLKFPADWEIRITPPFAGADARFAVQKGVAHVSVYLDFDGNLGAMDEPYWEVYPVDGECERCLLNETGELLAAIAKSIEQQNANPETANVS